MSKNSRHPAKEGLNPARGVMGADVAYLTPTESFHRLPNMALAGFWVLKMTACQHPHLKWGLIGERNLCNTCLPVKGCVELVDRWRDLEPGLKDSLHPLQADVLGPLDEAAQVPLWLNVLAN